jgi:tungstate transport system substrate-binding protein
MIERRTLSTWLAAAALSMAALGSALAQERFIVMASTTSTEQSGLFAHLLPAFKAATGINVRVVALGTGQALDSARRGDADVVFVHDQAAEEKFVAEGFGVKRLPVMYNDFVIVGPKNDPAGAKGKDVTAALKKLADGKFSVHLARRQERHPRRRTALLEDGRIDMAASKPAGYKECGCGMGPALNIGSSTNAYVLADRGTWLNFKNRGDLAVLVEGDKRLFNQYGVMLVNPAAWPHVKKDLAQAFVDWVVSPAGQSAIAGYKIGGEQLFFPNAGQ